MRRGFVIYRITCFSFRREVVHSGLRVRFTRLQQYRRKVGLIDRIGVVLRFQAESTAVGKGFSSLANLVSLWMRTSKMLTANDDHVITYLSIIIIKG